MLRYEEKDLNLEDVIDYKYIDRLCKIYLTKENTLIYDKIVISKGIVNLYKQNLQIEVVLCGDINEPKWKLLSIKENLLKDDCTISYRDPNDFCETNNRENIKLDIKNLSISNQNQPSLYNAHKVEYQLLNEFIKTVQFSFIDFNFSEMANLLRIYETHCSIFFIYNTFKRAREHCDLIINGGYKKFNVSIDQYIMNIEIGQDGSNIFCEIKTYNKTYSVLNIIQFIEEKITESLHKNSYFSLESGYIYCENEKESSNTIFIDEDTNFIKNLTSEELAITKFKFRTRSKLNRFIEDMIREKSFYRKIYEGLDPKYLVTRDNKKYGENNVTIKDKEKSVVIGLVSLSENLATVFIYSCVQLTDGVTQILDLKLSYNNQFYNMFFEKGNSNIEIESGLDFIMKNISVILSLNKFYKFRKRFKLSQNIHIDDIRLDCNGDTYKMNYNGDLIDCLTLDNIICRIFFTDFVKALAPFAQSSNPTSNLFLINTSSINNGNTTISFNNLISFYIQKQLIFLELHYKGFNVTLSYSDRLVIRSTNIVVTEMFRHSDFDFFPLINFLDFSAPFLSYNLMPTIFTPHKLMYNFKTQNDFFLIEFISNGYIIKTKTKSYNSNEPQFDIEALIEGVRKHYNEDRYNRAVSILEKSYTTTITSNYIECTTPFLKLRLDHDMKLKIIENISQVENNALECFLSESVTISEDLEVLKSFNDLNKINNMRLPQNK
ncbi:hypothetical protein NBO_448g0001 [Nosema bombycis CQ1]|uniref:Uncharacterized protein n=1 Tax=Nosema bombycis (strain CQ1 / CVCC 102059) TaxID=578461 RepID=R0M332_NOSB1|nr:hypothetical protein NBO_448g0001 [Nosema bombycis CQ1]|eukprot:EOB12404.1 hypothetical protein NBO_448g0001 [Nosema bombycis CQ1]